MDNRQLTRHLRSLEDVAVPDDVEARVFERMLATFDDPEADGEVADGDRTIGRADIVRLHDAPGSPERRRRGVVLPLLAAASVLAIAAMALTLLADRDDPSTSIPESELVAPVDADAEGPGGAGSGSVGEIAVDEELPRRIDGSFESNRLGTLLSFRADRPIWLIAHEPGYIELVSSVEDPMPDRLIISVPGDPSPQVAADGLEAYLRSGGAGTVSGQITPLSIDRVDSLYWRGTLQASGDCEPGGPCQVLYRQPRPIGLESGTALTDIGGRPMADGTTLVLVATLPFERFTTDPFGTFNAVVVTMRLDDEDRGSVDN